MNEPDSLLDRYALLSQTMLTSSPSLYPGSVVIIEEPEMCLHPGMFRAIQMDLAKPSDAWNRTATTIDGVSFCARYVFAAVGQFLSARVDNEEFGDTLEVVADYVKRGGPRWVAYFKIAMAVLFGVINSFREAWASFSKRKGR